MSFGPNRYIIDNPDEFLSAIRSIDKDSRGWYVTFYTNAIMSVCLPYRGEISGKHMFYDDYTYIRVLARGGVFYAEILRDEPRPDIIAAIRLVERERGVV